MGLPSSFRLIAPVGQAARHGALHFSAVTHFDSRNLISGVLFWPSGLQHHLQLRGQPLRKTSVLIPGPSWIEYRWISKTVPVMLVKTHLSVSDLMLGYYDTTFTHPDVKEIV